MRIDSDWMLNLNGRLVYADPFVQSLVEGPLAIKPKGKHRISPSDTLRGIDLHEVLVALQFKRNKIMVLRLLPRRELIKMLHLLPKNKMLAGLRFFSKEKLLRLMSLLPKAFLIKMLRHVMKLSELIAKLPTSELLAILRSERLSPKAMMGAFKKMDPKFLQFLIQKVTGQSVGDMSVYGMAEILGNLRKHQLMEGFKKLSYKALTPFVYGFVKQSEDLLTQLSDGFLFKQFERMPKSMLIESMRILPPETLLKFLGQLPTQVLPLVVAQLDDSVLMDYLVSQQPDLVALLGGQGQVA